MKTNTTRLILATAAFAAFSAAAEHAEKPVAVNTQGMPDHLKARIEKEAQQGPTALRRYLDSTRHIHNIRMESIVVPDERTPMVKEKEPSKVADRTEAPK
jgi:hypothetical protein